MSDEDGGYADGSLMRRVVALAMRTGIAPSAWLAEPPDVLDTAFSLLREEAEEAELASRGRTSSRAARARDPRLSSDTSDRG